MRTNIILNTDSYKLSHYCQYPPGTEYIYSYIESRGGEYDRTVFFGLQAFIKEYLMSPITQEDINEAEAFALPHGEPFNRQGWEHILKVHGGYLPIEIHAVPEGMLIPNKNVLLTIVNTDPKVPWLTSYLETSLLRAIWFPTTVATKSWFIKKSLHQYYSLTSDADHTEIDYKLVDFGARGVSSNESAALGGMAHLVNFKTTDTIAGVLAAKRYYHEPLAGFSVPAAEHSTITSWGKENETEAYRNMLKQFAYSQNISVVSDSYDIWNAVDNIWGKTLRQEVIDSGARLIIRPDSGDPITTPIDVVLSLMEKFGSTTNSKNYRVLPKFLRVLQGDGINPSSLIAILEKAQRNRLSAENFVFGMGGGLLQDLDRDTLKFAMKTSAMYRDGVWHDVFKEAPGKVSKRGRLALIQDKDGTYKTVPHDGNALNDILRLVYRNGDLMCDDSFEMVRYWANRGF